MADGRRGDEALTASPEGHGKAISRGIAAIGLARVAAIAFDALCFIVVARYLGPAEYGSYLSLLAFLTLLDITGDMMLVDVTVREVSRDLPGTGRWIGAATVLRLALGMAGLVVYGVYAWLGPVSQAPGLWLAAVVGALIVPVGALRMPLAAFRAHLKMEYELVILVATRFVNLLLFVLCMQAGLGLPSLFLAIVGSRLLLGVACWYVLLARLGAAATVDAAAVRHLFREALPLGVSGILVALQLKGDILMLSAMVGASAAGLYGVIAQLPEYLLSIPVIISTPVLPVLSRVFGSADRSHFHRLYQLLFDALCVLAIPFVVFGAFAPRETISFLFGHEFVDAAPAMPWIMLTIAVMWASHAVAIAAVAAHLQNRFVAIQCVAVVAYVLLNWLLIPRFGLAGAAMTRVVCTFIALAATYQLIARNTSATLSWSRLLRMTMAGAVMALTVLATLSWPFPSVVVTAAVVYGAGVWIMAAYPRMLMPIRERT